MQDVVIGIAAPLSGLAGRLGTEMKQAIGLAVKEKNDQGGIAGRKVSVYALDDGGNVRQAEEIAKKLCTVENIRGIIGHYGSDTSLAAARIYHEYDLPMIVPVASNPLLTDSGLSNVFRYTNRDDETASAISGYLYQQMQKRRAVVIRTATAYGKSMSDQFERSFTGSGGRIVETITVEEGDKDFAGLAASLPNEADLFFYGGTFEGAYLLKALRACGRMQLMAAGDGCWDKINFLDVAGSIAETGEGVLVLSASSAVGDIGGSREFADTYERTYGPVINYALNAYDAACLLLKALQKAAAEKQTIPSKKEALQSIWNVRFNGLANGNPVAWTAKGDNAGAITQLNIVENGRFKEILTINRSGILI